MLVDEDESLQGELQPKVRIEILNSAPGEALPKTQTAGPLE